MPRQRQRETVSTVDRMLSEKIPDEMESMTGWNDFSKIERLTLVSLLRGSSHAEAYQRARELSGLESITLKAALAWVHHARNRTDGFRLALNAITEHPERWRERLLAVQAADLLIDVNCPVDCPHRLTVCWPLLVESAFAINS